MHLRWLTHRTGVVAGGLVLLLMAAPATAQTFTGEVVGVKDGDTVEIMRGGRAVTVRLHGIDTPESGQPFGTRAKQYTATQVFGEQATVRVVDTDRYGRLVGVVTNGGAELNASLVRVGLAWWYERYAPDDGRLRRLQVQARSSDRGLWSRPSPVPPWDWRDGERSSRSSGRPASSDRAASGLPYDPDGRDRDCSDFDSQVVAQRFFRAAQPGDPHRLDGDNDGRACESLR